MSIVSLNGNGPLPANWFTQYGYSLLTKLKVAFTVYRVPPVTWKGWLSVVDWVKRPLGSPSEPGPLEMKPMNCPFGAVNWPKLPTTLPAPLRFQPGGKMAVSKPPLMIFSVVGSGGGIRPPVCGTMEGRLRLLLVVPVFTSSGRRAAAKATTCFLCCSLIDAHTAWLPPNCLEATNVPTSWFICCWVMF